MVGRANGTTADVRFVLALADCVLTFYREPRELQVEGTGMSGGRAECVSPVRAAFNSSTR
jgi:hypothetical protein